MLWFSIIIYDTKCSPEWTSHLGGNCPEIDANIFVIRVWQSLRYHFLKSLRMSWIAINTVIYGWAGRVVMQMYMRKTTSYTDLPMPDGSIPKGSLTRHLASLVASHSLIPSSSRKHNINIQRRAEHKVTNSSANHSSQDEVCLGVNNK